MVLIDGFIEVKCALTFIRLMYLSLSFLNACRTSANIFQVFILEQFKRSKLHVIFTYTHIPNNQNILILFKKQLKLWSCIFFVYVLESYVNYEFLLLSARCYCIYVHADN